MQPGSLNRKKPRFWCNQKFERAQPLSKEMRKRGETQVTAVLNPLCASHLCGRIPRLKRNSLLWRR
ncbi:hypothetical protein PSNIH1_15105 [Pantoea sp. PSNIH1]|nr:hypothetical protein PSNIH1_15105 [Pantoea sp. PSNIH1]